MKKTLRWTGVLALVLCLVLGVSAAFADGLKKGDSGSMISTLQEKLKALNYFEGTATGTFDQATEDALKEFQQMNGLEVNGTADSATISKLYAADAVKKPHIETLGETNARKSAESYLRWSAFSRQGLIDQLIYEGYSDAEAEYAVDNVDADWSALAIEKAKSYLSFMAFSYSGLIDQLEYEGFTTTEAAYGVSNCGADWNEQAGKKAQSYMSWASFSRSRLIDQLEYEGFTHEQAVYGASVVGY